MPCSCALRLSNGHLRQSDSQACLHRWRPRRAVAALRVAVTVASALPAGAGMNCQVARERVPAALRLGWRSAGRPPARSGLLTARGRRRSRPPTRTVSNRPIQRRFQSLAAVALFPDTSCPRPARPGAAPVPLRLWQRPGLSVPTGRRFVDWFPDMADRLHNCRIARSGDACRAVTVTEDARWLICPSQCHDHAPRWLRVVRTVIARTSRRTPMCAALLNCGANCKGVVSYCTTRRLTRCILSPRMAKPWTWRSELCSDAHA